MKNLPQRERRRRRMPGPYGRKGKAEFQYSDKYYTWRRSVMPRKAEPKRP
jgi:hypothetical protein